VAKVRYVKFPLIQLTPAQFKQRVAEAKGHLTLRDVGEPVARPKPKKKPGPAAPQARRFRVLCRVLGPEEWNLIFPEIPSEYGGTVCVRR
jgi:hypothetical protein